VYTNKINVSVLNLTTVAIVLFITYMYTVQIKVDPKNKLLI